MRAKMYFESDSYFQYYVSISMNTCMLVLILGGLSKPPYSVTIESFSLAI